MVGNKAEPPGPERVAAIYDVHGNLPALEAVLAEVRLEGVERVVVGGDVIPGPMPGECLSRLQDLEVPVEVLSGNGEADILSVLDSGMPSRVPAAFHHVMTWVAEALSREHVAWLGTWPATVTLDVGRLGRVMFCHATPRSDNEVFTKVTPAERLRAPFADLAAQVVVCGHTHMQFQRRLGDVEVCNAGSVGMPFGAPAAHWLLVGPDQIEFRQTEYDLVLASEQIAKAGYPAAFDVQHPASEADMLERFEASSL